MKDFTPHPDRLLSLDTMRGLIMILLAGESVRIYTSLSNMQLTGIAGNLVRQFFHHPWHGLRFWDLVHPAFMIMAGAALYLSFYQKTKKGISWKQNFRHIAIRCLKLFIFGIALYCIWNRKLVWELYNVLTQLGITTFIVYFIIRKSTVFQLAVSFAILILYDILYRIILIPGFDQPFVIGQNLGSFIDIVLMGKVNDEGWVFISFIPAIAFVIWGVQAGKLLTEPVSENKKVTNLVLAGITGLVTGYGAEACRCRSEHTGNNFRSGCLGLHMVCLPVVIPEEDIF